MNIDLIIRSNLIDLIKCIQTHDVSQLKHDVHRYTPAHIGLSLCFRGPPCRQWFFILLEVLNPTSSIHAFIEPFVVAKIKCVSRIFFVLLLLLKISCRQTCETDSPNPWGSIKPRLSTTAVGYERIKIDFHYIFQIEWI